MKLIAWPAGSRRVAFLFAWMLGTIWLTCGGVATGGAHAAEQLQPPAGMIAAAPPELDVSVEQNTEKLACYQVLELSFRHAGKYHDPTWDVSIDVVFRSPSGRRVQVGGFYYGPLGESPVSAALRGQDDRPGRASPAATAESGAAETGGRRGTAGPLRSAAPLHVWKARYAPSEPGRWTYRYTFRSPEGRQATGGGRFEVVRGRVHRPGWVRISKENPFRFVFEDGSPFFPVGFQDCEGDHNHNGTTLDSKSMEGPFRLDRADERPQPPPGAMFARGPSMNPVNADVYFGRHARAGFNIFRFSPNNCSIKVFTLDRVDWREAQMVDQLLQMVQKYQIRIYYGIFGFTKAYNDRPDDAEGMAKVKRIIKYSVDRWGAYVDIWELLNEQHAHDRWYAQVLPYLRSIDPYKKPVTTSWQRPELELIDINAPHWYGNENELQSDLVTAQRVRRDKQFGKPVVYGEQGNSRGRQDRTAEGIGGVWDPGSARRMRVRLWTALFTEAALIFWETSYAKDGHFMNLWIGPQERQYVKALQTFSGCLDAKVRPCEVTLHGEQSGEVRAYGLASAERAAMYLHHFACQQCRREGKPPSGHRWDHHRGEVHRLSVEVDVPPGAKGYWYEPRSGDILKRLAVGSGKQALQVPPFEVDIALLFTPGAPPDCDGDGVANDEDPDDDGDRVPDVRDAFPLEREEWADEDGDRIGDNFDADIDADGRADDRNHNGIPDSEEIDADGDGVPKAEAIPWDAFPNDPLEWADTDGDGIGDNADPDDDGDGYTDQEEKLAGTDPKSAISFP